MKLTVGTVSAADVLASLRVTVELLYGIVAVFWFASGPASIAVSRYVLLKQRPCTIYEALNPRRLRTFYVYSGALFVVVCCVPVLPYVLMQRSVLGAFIGLAIGIVLAFPANFVAMLAAVVFPAIAVDAKALSVKNVLADIKGMYWKIFKLYAVACSALVGFTLGTSFLFLFVGKGAGDLMIGFVATWNACIMAALASHVLIAVADKLIDRKPRPPSAAVPHIASVKPQRA